MSLIQICGWNRDLVFVVGAVALALVLGTVLGAVVEAVPQAVDVGSLDSGKFTDGATTNTDNIKKNISLRVCYDYQMNLASHP